MKPLASIALVLTAVASVLGVSVASAMHEQERILDQFAASTRLQVHASVDVLATRLDALDQDTRVLLDLVERKEERDSNARSWESAFHALANVVPQYRTIALFRRDGELVVMARDPSESDALVSALLPKSRELARAVAAKQTQALGDTVRDGDRSFLLYGTPAHDGGAIVVASDAHVFLSAVAWTPLPVARLFVTDPAGVVWSGCDTAEGCHAKEAGAIDASLAASPSTNPSETRRLDSEVANRLGLGRAPALLITETVTRPTGHWVVAWAASSEALLARERSLLLRIVITALAAAFAVAGVGVVVLRQQREAVTLEGQLRYAEALVRAEKLVTVGVLSAGIAHEIGSPLAVIRGRAEQVLRHMEWGPRAEDLRVIIKHTDSITRTIRELLDFSRRAPVTRKAVDLAPVVERARGLLQWKLDARDTTLEVTLPSDLPRLAADAEQLEQVLVNLLLNACDASEPRGVIRLRATTAVADAKARVVIEVEDTGCGIAPEHVNAVFDPFFTTKKRGEGTGLGLSSAASVVRNHGGEIDLVSAHGKGTTVSVTWPVLHAANEEDHA